MPTTIFQFFSAGKYEQVVAETERFLHDAPGSATAIQLKAQAHYQLGEYEDCTAVLENALVYQAGREPLETRLQLAALLANALLELGRYGDVHELVDHSAPRTSTAVESYGELLLADAWAAYFEGDWLRSREATRRIFECSGEHFTCARAALCAALGAHQEDGESHRDKAYLVKAQHHLEQTLNLMGNPEPVRAVFRIQVQLARRGASEEVGMLLQETQDLPAGSRIAAILRETAELYLRHAMGELDTASVIAAVGRGVKREWVALLPGAQVSVECPATYGVVAVVPRPQGPMAEPGPVPASVPAPAPVEPPPGSGVVAELGRLPNLAISPDLDRIFGADPPVPVRVAHRKPTPRVLPQPRAKEEPEESLAAAAPSAQAPPATPPVERVDAAPASGDDRAPSGIPVLAPVEEALARPRPSANRIVRHLVRTERDATIVRRHGAPAGTILLVTSLERVGRVLTEVIAGSPFRVVATAPDVENALEQYMMLRPSLVVVDVLAHGASGANGMPVFVPRLLEVDPHCKIVTISGAQSHAIAAEAVRQGARARIDLPFDRPRVLENLSRALAARSVVEALRVPTLELKRPVACSWKTLEHGMRDLVEPWHSFAARVLDPMGLDATLDVGLKDGATVRLNIEVPGAARPIQTLAEVVSSKEDRVLHHHAVRFSFLKLTTEAKDRLISFLMEALSRARVQVAGTGRAVS